MWTLRLALELKCHPFASYVTLTYSPDGLYRNEVGHCSLTKRDVQLYLKKLRKRVAPIKIRYFCCGEYGGLYKRPHYHLIIYGLSPNLRSHIKAMHDSWTDSDLDASLGHVFIKPCPTEALQYVAGYVTKKFVTKKDEYQRQPEFTLSSRKPGLGYVAILELAKILEKPNGKKLFKVLENGLPGTIRLQGRQFPLGRFCLDKLKDHLWLEKTPGVDSYLTESVIKYLHSADKFDDENAIYGRLAMAMMAEDEQKAKLMTAKHKIYNARGKR